MVTDNYFLSCLGHELEPPPPPTHPWKIKNKNKSDTWLAQASVFHHPGTKTLERAFSLFDLFESFYVYPVVVLQLVQFVQFVLHTGNDSIGDLTILINGT